MPYDGTLPRVSLPQLLYLLPPILPDRRLPKIHLERAREGGVLRLTPRCEPVSVTRETAGAGPHSRVRSLYSLSEHASGVYASV